MAFTLRLKRGNKKDLPVLKEGEPGFVLDEGKLYIGDGQKNIALPNQDDLDEVKKSVADGKTKVAKAISDKGQATESGATFDKMAENIGKIETGIKTDDATAVAGDVLSGKTAYVKDKKITGTIASRAGGTYTPSSSQQTLVPANTYVTSNVIMQAVQLSASVGGTKRTYTVIDKAVNAGQWVNVIQSITSNSPGITVGNAINNLTVAESESYNTKMNDKTISQAVANGKEWMTISIHDALTTSPKGVLIKGNDYTSGIGTIIADYGKSNSASYFLSEAGTIGREIIGNNQGCAILKPNPFVGGEQYIGDKTLYLLLKNGSYFTVQFRMSNSYNKTADIRTSGGEIIKLTDYRYLILGRGCDHSSSVAYDYMSMKGRIFTINKMPPASASDTSVGAPITLINRDESIKSSDENFRYIRGVRISDTQAFAVARIRSLGGNNYYRAMVINVSTENISIAKKVDGEFATYGLNDMVAFDAGQAVFVGRYTDTNYLRYNIFSYSGNITLVKSVNVTNVTNIYQLQALMITNNVMLTVTASLNGGVYATYMKVSTGNIVHMSTHLLFSGEVNSLSICKIDDSKVLLVYQPINSYPQRRVLTIPTVATAKPYNTSDGKIGVAVTSGAVGATISVAEPT